MNRNFNITLPNSQEREKNLINIDIGNLSSIINYSADTVRCSCLEYLDSGIIANIVGDILQKIKPGGQATFIVTDIKKYSTDFISGLISGQELLHMIKPINSILSIEDLYTKIDANLLRVVQVLKENNTISVTVERMSV